MEPKPPRGSPRDRKFGMKRWMFVVIQSFNALTEFRDFVNAIYYALPNWLQTANNDIDRFRIAMANLSQADAAAVFRNLLINEIGDRLAAAGGKADKAFYKRVFDRTGVDLGTMGPMVQMMRYLRMEGSNAMKLLDAWIEYLVRAGSSDEPLEA